jgi:hypothetical protein
MIGTLYRYPHPYDPARFVYVGQGPNRDKNHRSGKLDFGLRFKNRFPDVELPQPIKEQIEVSSQLELNEEETIWMFRYHTWRGYPDGMNLTFPGSHDYKVMGVLGGSAYRKFGHPGNKNAHLNLTFEARSKGAKRRNEIYAEFAVEIGRRSGQKNVESGHIQALGRKQGRKLVETGVLASYRTPEHQAEACRARNAIHGNPQTKEGSLKGACGFWNIKRNKPCTCGMHKEL